ncbi:MAG: hypothetical protein BMS9Abin23_0987 [Thermodesulfobacteriota bacterium]|nr:MAG: hypothetical protein BMS9Abin23_0987 [Thermodesulfobacteriota bacterium]
MKRQGYIALLTALLLTISFSVSSGKSTSGAIRVSAHVLPVISKTISNTSSLIVITGEDIKRGYVEVRNATLVEVRTNSREGYLITIEQSALLFKEIWVSDGSRTIILTGRSGLFHQPYSNSRGIDRRSLSYRFVLPENIEAGTYPWPLLINASI